MGARAVDRFGKAGGAGAIGSEEEDMATETEAERRSREATEAAARERSVVQGGPGSEGGVAPQFAFKYKDKAFATEKELSDYIDGLGTEITTLKAKPPTVVEVPGKPTAATITTTIDTSRPQRIEDLPDDQLITMVLSNPKGLVQGIKNDMRSEYQQADQSRRNMERFWEQFWDENKELKPYKQVVDMVFDANSRTVLGPMLMDDARKKLGELARNTVLTINKDAFTAPKRPSSEGRALIEGGGPATQQRQTEQQEPQGPKSLTEAIKARQRSRAEPQQKKAS